MIRVPSHTNVISCLFTFLLLVIDGESARHLNLPKESPCSTSDISSGVCRSVKDCKVAQQMIQNNKNPTICTFEGIEPIVCCPEPINSDPPIHVKKCQEYGDKVYVRTRAPGVIKRYYNRSLCAITSKPLVFGGEDANPKEFPHMALVGYEKNNTREWDCGGSLISENFVLTAGHCLYHWDLGFAKYVRLGDLDIASTTDSAMTEELKVVEQIYHPDYKPPAQYHDIGLLKLEKAATINAFVRPICLYSKSEIPLKFLATGWGATEHDDISNVLQKVTLQLYSHESCSASYKNLVSKNKLPNGIEDRTQICAGGGPDEEKDTCVGDSGGPLQIYNNDVKCMYYIIGVTSVGKECGQQNSPGVYTRVSGYIPWIESVVWAT